MYSEYESFSAQEWGYPYDEDGFVDQLDEYLAEDEDWYLDEWYEDIDLIEGEFVDYDPRYRTVPVSDGLLGLPFHPLTLIAAFLLVFMISKVAIDRFGLGGWEINMYSAPQDITPSTDSTSIAPPKPVAPIVPDLEMAQQVIAPYESYVLTQGPHGYSYGHMAIDLTAGHGAEIRSPIQGVVSELFVDGIGNTVVVIENQVYRVMLLHGLYTVAVGDVVEIGQVIGTESNQGNTYDAAGLSCRGRDCGYHTHLNIFDKRLGTNVNPLELIE